MKRYYVTNELNAVCVWDSKTGVCVYQTSRYVDGYSGYEKAVKECDKYNSGYNFNEEQ